MNIASFLSPKEEVTFLRDDMTIRQGLEKMKRYGYTAVPVIVFIGIITRSEIIKYFIKKQIEVAEKQL